ncbi:hypothetical protein CUMW_229010 [Citrus unshiu]|uniref:WAT1-related protein n=1 Tax=Citrus unshiu TaxID=55188 RepID=A0A2H5QGU9_CITUN|nr:hypothetical protein CUMW_229010 [Citrus unshiu]
MAIVMCCQEASFNQGLNPHIYVTYRHAAGSLVMFPFAYFLERKIRPKLTLSLFLEMFLLSLQGLEIVGVRSPRGIAKIVGTLTSLVGVIVIAFYKGPAVPSLKGAPIHLGTNSVLENWLKGSILTLASRMLWSSFYITQAFTLKKYPAKLSLSAWMNGIGAAQSAVYTGAVSSCLNVFIPLWCIEQKGPVFVTIFNPLITVIVAIAAYFLVGEKLILGGVIIIIGLYSLLWGKEGDQHCLKNQKQSFPTCDVQKKPKGPCFKFIRNRDPLTNHIPYLQWNYGIVSKNTYQTNGKIEVKLVTKVFNSL